MSNEYIRWHIKYALSGLVSIVAGIAVEFYTWNFLLIKMIPAVPKLGIMGIIALKLVRGVLLNPITDKQLTNLRADSDGADEFKKDKAPFDAKIKVKLLKAGAYLLVAICVYYVSQFV